MGQVEFQEISTRQNHSWSLKYEQIKWSTKLSGLVHEVVCACIFSNLNLKSVWKENQHFSLFLSMIAWVIFTFLFFLHFLLFSLLFLLFSIFFLFFSSFVSSFISSFISSFSLVLAPLEFLERLQCFTNENENLNQN